MKKILCLSMMLCVIALISCGDDEADSSSSATRTGSILGLVTDYVNSNAPIAGASVTLNQKGITKTTGVDGRFEFTNIEPGTYTIQVMANNYQATTKQVTVYARQNVNCDFQLSKSSASIDFSTMNLSFGKDVSQMSFTIRNNSTNQLGYSISSVPDYIKLSSSSGLIAAKGNQAIMVTINNRSSIISSRNAQMIVTVGDESFVINIFIEGTNDAGGGSNGGNTDNPGGGGNSGGNDVTRGLQALFTFDDGTAKNSRDASNSGTVYPGSNYSYITDTPSGKGKALSLGNQEYLRIPKNVVEGSSAFSVSLWVKDFGAGPLFISTFGDDTFTGSPRLFIDESNFFCVDGTAEIYDTVERIGLSATPYQSNNWHMITATFANRIIYLYIDGVLVGNATSDANVKGHGSLTAVGGKANGIWSSSMKVDNVRVYSVALTDAEVTSLYNYER